MHCVLETPTFASAAKAVGLTEDERHEIVTTIANDPQNGKIIPGTGGARKIRFGGQGKGKRSAFRVITYYAADDIPVFLLDIYSKGERVNLTQDERNEIKNILGGIADDYRKSTEERIARFREIAS